MGEEGTLEEIRIRNIASVRYDTKNYKGLVKALYMNLLTKVI